MYLTISTLLIYTLLYVPYYNLLICTILHKHAACIFVPRAMKIGKFVQGGKCTGNNEINYSSVVFDLTQPCFRAIGLKAFQSTLLRMEKAYTEFITSIMHS